MACGGCSRRGQQPTPTSGAGDLTRYAFLTPRQLKLREQQLEERRRREAEQKGPGK